MTFARERWNRGLRFVRNPQEDLMEKTNVQDPDTSTLDKLRARITSEQARADAGGERWRVLETFPAPAGIGLVTFTTSEFTSMCPVTGQPDFCSIEIAYDPGMRCIESKSLKLYLQTFRNEGHFCEALAVIIASDIKRACHPMNGTVTVKQTPRGGIALAAEAYIEFQEVND
jgi:7-cyano-7-deazaguanine reductase